MNLRTTILTFSLIFGLTGYSSFTRGIYGMKNPKKTNKETIARSSKKYKIPQADNYELDTSYLSFLFSLDTTRYREQIKNHYQPLQVLYYDKNGQLESFQINYYAGGFPNLHWDRDSILTTFPPRVQAPPDSVIPLDHKNHNS